MNTKNIVGYYQTCNYGYGGYEVNHYSRVIFKGVRMKRRTSLQLVDERLRERLIAYPKILPFCTQIRISRKTKTGMFSSKLNDINMPLYLVHDGSNFYEFLTGIKIAVASVGYHTYDSGADNTPIFREFIAANPVAVSEEYINLALRDFSDKELSIFASEFRKRVANAKKWSAEYDKVFAKVQRDLDKELKQIEKMSKQSKFGKF